MAAAGALAVRLRPRIGVESDQDGDGVPCAGELVATPHRGGERQPSERIAAPDYALRPRIGVESDPRINLEVRAHFCFLGGPVNYGNSCVMQLQSTAITRACLTEQGLPGRVLNE